MQFSLASEGETGAIPSTGMAGADEPGSNTMTFKHYTVEITTGNAVDVYDHEFEWLAIAHANRAARGGSEATVIRYNSKGLGTEIFSACPTSVQENEI